MIIGVGVDLVDMRRLERLVHSYKERLTTKLFTAEERSYAEASSNPIRAYANRFAAKEATSKALGTGFTEGISWQDIEVTRSPAGAPLLSFHGRALDKLLALTPEGYTPLSHISFSDEPPYSTAFVVLSAAPLLRD